jgi:hypothetical protein
MLGLQVIGEKGQNNVIPHGEKARTSGKPTSHPAATGGGKTSRVAAGRLDGNDSWDSPRLPNLQKLSEANSILPLNPLVFTARRPYWHTV